MCTCNTLELHALCLLCLLCCKCLERGSLPRIGLTRSRTHMHACFPSSMYVPATCAHSACTGMHPDPWLHRSPILGHTPLKQASIAPAFAHTLRMHTATTCACTHPPHAHVQVHMSALGSGLAVDETIELFCGEGEQVLQWIGYAACSRLAYKRGEIGSGQALGLGQGSSGG